MELLKTALKHLYCTPISGDKKDSILFIHGMWSNYKAWEYWLQAFVASDYQCWSIDLNPRNGNTSILDYADMVKNAITHIKKETGTTPILIGHSMGALIAQLIASEIKLPKLVLLSSVGPSGIFNIRWPLLRNLYHYLPQILSKQLFQPSEAALDRLVLHRHPDDKKEIMEEIQSDSGLAAREIMFTMFSKKLRVDDLSGTKTLVIGGKYDKIMPHSIQKILAKKYNCDYYEFPHGHMIMLEKNSGPTLNNILVWLDN